MRAHPSLGKFMKCCFLSICNVAWLCSHARPGRHWPTCFDQTCGCPGEGTVDNTGLTRSTRAQSDSDAGAQDMLHGETQDERGQVEEPGVQSL